jgi:hypothetical protein
MRSVNAEIAVVAAEFERTVDEPFRWGFACECGEAGCTAWVDLDLAAYTAVRSDGTGAVLAEGHSPSRAGPSSSREGKARQSRETRLLRRAPRRPTAAGYRPAQQR